MLFRHIQHIGTALRAAQGQVLLKVTEGSVTEVSLEQLIRESG
jgi:hypothetical protein